MSDKRATTADAECKQRKVGWVVWIAVSIVAGLLAACCYYLAAMGFRLALEWRSPIGAAVTVAVAVTLVLGVVHAVGDQLAIYVVQQIRTEEPDARGRWTGLVERTVFLAAAALQPQWAAAGVFPWIGIKLAANWGVREAKEHNDQLALASARTSAVVGGLTSIGVAIAGGVLLRWLLFS